MGLFGNQIAFIDTFESILYRAMQDSVNQFDFVLKDYIVNKQLFRQGIDGNKQKLAGYVRTTIRYKLRKGDPVDRTTLRDEGDFHDTIEITGTPYYFVVTTNVDYDKWIFKRYGKDVIKVTNDNMREFMQVYLLPNLKKTVNDKLAR